MGHFVESKITSSLVIIRGHCLCVVKKEHQMKDVFCMVSCSTKIIALHLKNTVTEIKKDFCTKNNSL